MTRITICSGIYLFIKTSPRLLIIPISNIMAAIIINPEPQIPLGRTLPMVIIMGSKVIGSIEKSSMAPLAARMPNFNPPPSKAGPAEQAQACFEDGYLELPTIGPLPATAPDPVDLDGLAALLDHDQ